MKVTLITPTPPDLSAFGVRSLSAYLRSKGVDAVIPFRTMLADLIANIETNRNYQKSDLLQTLRILKNYDFFKEPQLELFKAKRRPRKGA